MYIHKEILHLQHNHWDLAFTVFTGCLPVFTGLLYMVWQIFPQYFFFAISTRTWEFFKLTISSQMHLKDLKKKEKSIQLSFVHVFHHLKTLNIKKLQNQTKESYFVNCITQEQTLPSPGQLISLYYRCT